MTTANDVIQDALEMLGIYGPGDTVSNADQSRMFFLLNAMLDEWAAQNIFPQQLISLTATLVATQAAYTIGASGASITAARPNQITYGQSAASVTMSASTSKVSVVSAVEYQALLAYAPAAGRTNTAWYNPTYPNGTLTLLPTPNAVGTLTFEAWYRLVSFANPTDVYSLAVGVLDALRDNLAVSAKTYFTNSPLDPVVVLRAATAKDFLRYQSQTSRAMFNRFTLATNPAKAA